MLSFFLATGGTYPRKYSIFPLAKGGDAVHFLPRLGLSRRRLSRSCFRRSSLQARPNFERAWRPVLRLRRWANTAELLAADNDEQDIRPAAAVDHGLRQFVDQLPIGKLHSAA